METDYNISQAFQVIHDLVKYSLHDDFKEDNIDIKTIQSKLVEIYRITGRMNGESGLKNYPIKYQWDGSDEKVKQFRNIIKKELTWKKCPKCNSENITRLKCLNCEFDLT